MFTMKLLKCFHLLQRTLIRHHRYNLRLFKCNISEMSRAKCSVSKYKSKSFIWLRFNLLNTKRGQTQMENDNDKCWGFNYLRITQRPNNEATIVNALAFILPAPIWKRVKYTKIKTKFSLFWNQWDNIFDCWNDRHWLQPNAADSSQMPHFVRVTELQYNAFTPKPDEKRTKKIVKLCVPLNCFNEIWINQTETETFHICNIFCHCA